MSTPTGTPTRTPTSTPTHIGTTEAAHYLGISTVRLRILLQQGRVKGAEKQGRTWIIPLFNGMPVIEERGKGPKATWYKRRREAETCILVNRQIIGKNAKEGQNEPPIVVKEGKNQHECHELEINGPCRIVYTPHETGPCGARLWIEAAAHVPLVRKIFATFQSVNQPMKAVFEL
jgi:hypothetical protein